MFLRFLPLAALMGVILSLGIPRTAMAEPPSVLATIRPIHALVAAVMAGIGTPDLLVTGGASPHGMTLKPSDARKVERANLIVRVGPALEGFLGRVLQGGDERRVLTLMDAPGIILLDGDPHIWLAPANGRAIAEAVAARLSEMDPARAPLYQANAKAVKRDLQDLESQLARLLAPVRTKPFIVFHDAYRYFEHAFGLEKAGRVYVMAERTPGAGHIQELIRQMRHQDITCLFTEPQFAPKLAFVIAAETGARTGVLDPLGADIKPGPGLYAQLMKRNAKTLITCLKPQQADG